MAQPNEVILYTKEKDCAPCVEAKNFLNLHNISYVEKDVGVRENLMELVKQYRLMTVPVLVVDNTPFTGFDLEEYRTRLGLKSS
jgi:glutaredoxin